jgi:hypothetical protein
MKQYETYFVDLTGPAFLVPTLRGSCSVQATDDLRLCNECQNIQEGLCAVMATGNLSPGGIPFLLLFVASYGRFAFRF